MFRRGEEEGLGGGEKLAPRWLSESRLPSNNFACSALALAWRLARCSASRLRPPWTTIYRVTMSTHRRTPESTVCATRRQGPKRVSTINELRYHMSTAHNHWQWKFCNCNGNTHSLGASRLHQNTFLPSDFGARLTNRLPEKERSEAKQQRDNLSRSLPRCTHADNERPGR